MGPNGKRLRGFKIGVGNAGAYEVMARYRVDCIGKTMKHLAWSMRTMMIWRS